MQENPSNESPNTSSLPPEVTANLQTATGMDRVATVLFNEVKALRQEVNELKTQKILDETQLPPEILAENGMLPTDPSRLRRGRGFRPLLRSEIEDAIKVSPFCSDQARYLGVCARTLKTYALPLGLWNPQPHHRGCKKPWGPEKGKYPLSKILSGEMNDCSYVTDWLVKAKVFKAKTFPEECVICGYKKKHLVNGQVPLLLDHIDGNGRNFKQDNLRLLCWNCMIECGRGYLRRGIKFFDPNWQINES